MADSQVTKPCAHVTHAQCASQCHHCDTNKKTSQVKRKLLGYIWTPVGDETAHTISLEHDSMSYNNAIAYPDAKF